MMLLDQGYLVDIACCVDQEVNDILLNRGVEVYDLPFTRNPLDLRNLKAFKKLSKIQKRIGMKRCMFILRLPRCMEDC